MNYLNIELEGINENGEKASYRLVDFKRKNISLYFYPEDDTPVCTKEAQDFRDSLNELKEYAEIIGVSRNGIEEHIQFQKNHKLNFKILSDNQNKLKNAFKEHLTESTDIHRSTFILNKDGKIIKSWEKVDVDEHIKEIVGFFKKKEFNS